MSAVPARIDAHQHFWRLSRGDYRWLRPELGLLWRDYEPKQLAPHLARCGIARSVLVQAADTLAETRFLLEIARAHPSVAAVIGWIDFSANDAVETIEELCDEPRLVGLRPMLQDLGDPRWMLRRELDPVWREMSVRGLRLDALVRSEHLGHLRELAARHPGLTLVVDHLAKPCVVPFGERWTHFDAWRDHLRGLARHTRASCKLSGLATEAAASWCIDDLRPYVDVALEAFGPERLLWGSDWPVVELRGGYCAWWEATLELLRPLAERERAGILGGNAVRVYGLGDGEKGNA